MKLHHFTSMRHLEKIVADQILTRSDSMISAHLPTSMTYPTVVWLLDTPVLEHDHGLSGSSFDKTEVRITVDVEDRWLTRWLDYAAAQGIHPHWRDAVVRKGGGPDAAAHWWISFRRIAAVDWVSIENVKTGERLWTT